MKAVSSRRARACSIPQSVKAIVYHRDGGRCVYCLKPGNPEAHYISRKRGGLGIPQNILTLCRECHDKYDHGDKKTREGMAEYFREYLESKYTDWSEDALVYDKWR